MHETTGASTRSRRSFPPGPLRAALLALLPLVASAQAPTPAPTPAYAKQVEVTATRILEEADKVPAALTVLTGQELLDRGATDLRSALGLAAGVDIAPGGDGGPASSVPELWGLKELDAFLLVVDGVPWGGAFNPALGSLDLHDVDRIEVLRGPAPVLYGATSFVGVIQVVHNAAGRSARRASAFAGNHSSGGASVTAPLPPWKGFESSLGVDGERQGYRDDRTDYRRGHVLFRSRRATSDGGSFGFDVDGAWLDQDPASPHPRTGTMLASEVPLDANHNPEDAFLDERRLHLSAGFDHPVGAGTWSTTAAFTRSSQDVLRGFLTDVTASDPDGHGLREKVHVSDLYLDTHLGFGRSESVRGVAGADYLHGSGTARGGDFDYFVNLDGSGAPSGDTLPSQSDARIHDQRDFLGFYGQLEWNPVPAVRVDLGARLNHTRESRESSAQELDAPGPDTSEGERSDTRLGGGAGVVWTPWQQDAENVRLFASYRNTFKPAAIDFNIGDADAGGGGEDGEGGILKPETARSYEAGLRASLCGGQLALEASSFRMTFHNLVVPQAIDGLPSLVNAGEERLQGIETSAVGRLAHGLELRGTYAFHDAHFTDFLTEFDGVPTQLRGKRLEMSPRHLASAGLGWFPAMGWIGQVRLNWVGERFLDKRNRALASGYATLAAGVGYRRDRWEVRLDGTNLTDRRPPVSESELGDAQYYRLPARRVNVSGAFRF